MFEIRLSDVVCSLKDMLIPRGQENARALYMCFDVSMAMRASRQMNGRRSLIHFLLHSPYGGSVHTFVAEQDFGGVEQIADLDWKNTSNHDSCWRSDGVDSPINKIYFRMADEINADLRSRERREMAPRDMHQRCSFNIFSSEWKLLDVKLKSVEDYGYSFEVV